MGTRQFIPFGEFLPDKKLFSNDGLLRAFGVTPVSSGYIQAPEATIQSPRLSDGPPYGFGLHQTLESGARKLYGYYGSETALRELEIGNILLDTDRSRATGYSFLSSPPQDVELWWFTSYGDIVIATNFNDEVQSLATPGSGVFADMITSTFKPQARFAFPIRQNLFLAYVYIPTTYAGFSSGAHEQLLCWSMNDNVASFGAESVDPAFIGAGIQPINNDLGPITAGIGGDFGIVFQTGGIVRIDGPPYEFRTIVEGDTTLYPYSVFKLDGDIYFWGASGPSVLRGGEPPVERLAVGRVQRTLLDNVTGFGAIMARASDLLTRQVSGGPDPSNKLLRWSYAPISTATALGVGEAESADPSTLLLDYEVDTGRFTVSKTANLVSTLNNQHLFIRQAPAVESQQWGPFGRLYCLGTIWENLGLGFGNTYRALGYALQSEDSIAVDMEWKTGFGKLNDQLTSRIVAVRPIFSETEGLGTAVQDQIEVYVHTKNLPWEDQVTKGAFTTVGSDGWVGTDDAVLGTYHAVTFKLVHGPSNNEVHEVEGVEIEYVTGAAYGA